MVRKKEIPRALTRREVSVSAHDRRPALTLVINGEKEDRASVGSAANDWRRLLALVSVAARQQRVQQHPALCLVEEGARDGDHARDRLLGRVACRKKNVTRKESALVGHLLGVCGRGRGCLFR